MTTIGTDVNRTIDDALDAFAYGIGTVEIAIENGAGEEALPTLAQLHVAFKRMAGLARLSVTPFDHTPYTPRTWHGYCGCCGTARNFTEGKCDVCASVRLVSAP